MKGLQTLVAGGRVQYFAGYFLGTELSHHGFSRLDAMTPHPLNS